MSNSSDNTPANGVHGSSYLYDYGTSPNTRTAVSQKVRILTPVFGENTALHQMGVLSSFSPSQSRGVDPVRGIGFGDQVAELVPGVTEPVTSSFERALLYLCNLWQATGYAAGIDGPVRSLAHHRWPFDVEQQLVFSSLADADINVANVGHPGSGFDGGTKALGYGGVTNYEGDGDGVATSPETRGHFAIITMYEACWFTDWSATFGADSGLIMESGSFTASDVHDFSSYYGEFLATGNDPTIGQLGSLRFGSQGGNQGGGAGTIGSMTAGGEQP